ncbi:MAG: cytochrome c [Bacteroidota bacterium]
MKNTFKFTLLLSTVLVMSCTNDSESDLLIVDDTENTDNGSDEDVDDVDDGTITFSTNIQPIIAGNCLGCHSSPPRNGAPFPLVTFDQVRARNGGVLTTISRQTGEPSAMPPSGRLPQASIDLIDQWIQEGLLE